jgi:hypothetical protein
MLRRQPIPFFSINRVLFFTTFLSLFWVSKEDAGLSLLAANAVFTYYLYNREMRCFDCRLYLWVQTAGPKNGGLHFQRSRAATES